MESTMAITYSIPCRRALLSCAVAAGIALSAGGAAAQNTNDVRSPSPAKAETKREEKDARKQWEQTHRASRIIGSEVRNPQDQKVGRVKDLVLADPSSGTISHAVVSIGGVAGMGDKLFAVPFNQLQRAPGKDYLVLSGSSDLSKAFDEKSWPEETAWQGGYAGRAASAPPASTPPDAPELLSSPGPAESAPRDAAR
jgi:sporulation protein YlmC with PRC-barrel domain